MQKLFVAFVVLPTFSMLSLGEVVAADRHGAVATAPLASIKFDPEEHFVLIPVRLGGREYQFVLDTGSARSTFDIALRSRLGQRIDTTRVVAADGREVDLDCYDAPDAR